MSLRDTYAYAISTAKGKFDGSALRTGGDEASSGADQNPAAAQCRWWHVGDGQLARSERLKELFHEGSKTISYRVPALIRGGNHQR